MDIGDDILLKAMVIYHGEKLSADKAAKNTFHELAAPLAEVIRLLDNIENEMAALDALGANSDAERAIERHEIILHGLHVLLQPPGEPHHRNVKFWKTIQDQGA